MGLEVDTGGLGLSQPVGALSNIRNAQTAAYAVATSDQGTTIALGGNAFYALTLGAASGFPSNFMFLVLNEDSGRGKSIQINGLSNFVLWPLQSIIVFNDNGTWQVHGQRRWKMTGATINVYVDPLLGIDTVGATDGLASGTAAFATTNHALNYFCCDQTDYSGIETAQTIVQINVAGTDPTRAHWSPHPAAPGAQGAAAITIDGGGTAVLSGGLQLYFGAVVSLQNITIQNASGNGADIQQNATLYLPSAVTIGACSGSGINLADGGLLYAAGTVTLSGNCTSIFNLTNGAKLDMPAGSGIALSTNITATQFIAMSGSCAVFGNPTITLNGHTFTGNRCALSGLSYLGLGGGALIGSGDNISLGGTTSAGTTTAGGFTGAQSFTSKGVLYGQGGGAIAATSSVNSAVLVTDGSGNPSLSTTVPAGVTVTNTIDAGSAASTATLTKTTDTAFATITGMSVALTAGKTYVFEGHITVTASGASGGAKITLATSDTLTATALTMTGLNMNGATTNAQSTATALGSAIGAATAVTTDIYICGTITVNAAGTCVVQGAQNASNATGTTFGIGSYISFTRIN